MRIVRARIHGFGGAPDGELRLVPGLNIVHGPNESGKSSLHQALLFGLCGMERSRAREVSERRERLRPWAGGGQRVTLTLELAGGRLVEVDHDFVRGVSTAHDLATGRELGPEIEAAGAVDATRWLGMNRQTFRLTAAVGQADILLLERDVDVLNRHLQSVLAGAGGSRTAAEAIAAVVTYRQNHVGAVRTGSTRPLAVALAEREACEEKLHLARAAHAELVELADRLAALDVELKRRVAGAGETYRRQAEADLEEIHRIQAGLAQPDPGWIRVSNAQVALLAADAALQAHLDSAPSAPSVPAPLPAWRWLLPLAAGAVGLGLAALLTITGRPAGLAAAGLGIGLVVAGAALRWRWRGDTEGAAGRHRHGLWVERAGVLTARRDRAAAALAAALAAEGVETSGDPLAGFQAWNSARAARRERDSRRLGELLAGRNLPGLEIGSEDFAVADPGRVELIAARARLQGEYDARRAVLPSLVEAEEALRRADRRVEKLKELGQVLDTAEHFLNQAQERAHRELAPGLAGRLAPGLARVTGGRYLAAHVDPADFTVRLRDPGGELRSLSTLSRGTHEQVVLLLRIALAEILTREGESAPLLLDEVTVSADQARTEAILELLSEMASRHQVVLFTQEESVRAWAAARLRAPEAQLIQLPGPSNSG